MPKRKTATTMPVVDISSSPKRIKTSKDVKKPTSTYTPQQKAAIQEFSGVTQADKSSAAKVLKANAWNVGAAVNAYFNNGAPQSPARAPLGKIFDAHRDDPKNEPDEINIEGTTEILGQLEIGLDDVGTLIFSEIVKSPTLGKILRDGFVDGWADLNIESLPKMRNFVLGRRSELSTNVELFKNVYTHTFQLALPTGAKTLPLEMAVEFWRMLFTSPGYQWSSPNSPWLDWWLEFQEAKNTKAVNKDLWKQTLAFARETMKDESLSFWSDESSWPSVIDEFVEWIKEEKRGGSGDAMAVDER